MKKYSLAVDAGGTKLQALLFDDQMQLLRSARAGGTNINISTAEEVRYNMAQCLNDLLTDETELTLQCVYHTFIGPFPLFCELLEAKCTVERYQNINEGIAGMLAGMLSPTGLCAMSGTGSDVYYAYRKGGSVSRGLQDVECPMAVGGWGAVISDGGSGAWMGRKAMECVEAMVEGLLPESPLLHEVEAQLHAHGKGELIRAVYASPAPFRLLAKLTTAIARAADAGDPAALDIFRQAGEKMAQQTWCQMKRHGILPGSIPVVCCGGAWKAHAAMFESFRHALSCLCPGQEAVKPLYEQVCAGVVLYGLEQGMSRKEIQEKMDANFSWFQIKW